MCTEATDKRHNTVWFDESRVWGLPWPRVWEARGYAVLVILLLLGGCTHEDRMPSLWIPPGGDSHNTFFYPRSSSTQIREPTLELLWNSGPVPPKREDILVRRTQYLSTGMSSGRMVLGVFEGGISFFQDDGEVISHQPVEGLTFGFLADVEGRGSSSAFVKTDEGIRLYDIQGNLQRRLQTGGYVLGMNVAKLDIKSGFHLITAEREWVPAPEGTGVVEWDKRTVRCYNVQTLEREWEHRVGPWAHIGAVEDINDDGDKEIICGTYSPENRVFWEDMVDTSHGYVFALDRFGRRLWMRTFKAQYASIWPSVADLDGDGDMEVVVACGSWLKNWGGVYVLNAKDGSIVSRFPSDRDLECSITVAGIADLNGDGKQEIICSSVGQQGGFFVLDHQCNPIGAAYDVFSSSVDYDFVVCRLEAINDIDGDGKPEIIGSTSFEKVIAMDPRFTYLRLTEPQLVVLSSTLSPKITLTLDEAPSEVIVSDLIPGGANEIIVLADEVSVYGIREGKK